MGISIPIGSYSFILRVEGVYEIPVKGVRAFQKQNNYEKIKEGGVNDFVHLRRMPIQEPFTIQIERYVSNSFFDPLANGSELMLPLILQVLKTADIKGGYNADSDKNTGKVFVFTGCTVMGKEYGELNAEQSGLATETVTIGYKEMFIFPNMAALGGTPPTGSGPISAAELEKKKADQAALNAKIAADQIAQQRRIAASKAELAANAQKTKSQNQLREAQDQANKKKDEKKIAQSKKELAENATKTASNNTARDSEDKKQKDKDADRIAQSKKELEENAKKTKTNNSKRDEEDKSNKKADVTKEKKSEEKAKENKATDEKMQKDDEARRKKLAEDTKKKNEARNKK